VTQNLYAYVDDFAAIAGMEPQIWKDIAGSSRSMFATLRRRNGARRGRWSQKITDSIS
jgi:hypothetical protein